MNKKDYTLLLKDPRWKQRADYIKKRDRYTCCDCNKNTGIILSVHHLFYLPGKLPWEVPDSFLVTLCLDCHEKRHENKSIKDFIYKGTEVKKVKKPKKKKNRDVIQERYDKLRAEGKLPSLEAPPKQKFCKKTKKYIAK